MSSINNSYDKTKTGGGGVVPVGWLVSASIVSGTNWLIFNYETQPVSLLYVFSLFCSLALTLHKTQKVLEYI